MKNPGRPHSDTAVQRPDATFPDATFPLDAAQHSDATFSDATLWTFCDAKFLPARRLRRALTPHSLAASREGCTHGKGADVGPSCPFQDAICTYILQVFTPNYHKRSRSLRQQSTNSALGEFAFAVALCVCVPWANVSSDLLFFCWRTSTTTPASTADKQRVERRSPTNQRKTMNRHILLRHAALFQSVSHGEHSNVSQGHDSHGNLPRISR